MSLVLDAGAFVSLERNQRETVALLKRELRARRPHALGEIARQAHHTPVREGGAMGSDGDSPQLDEPSGAADRSQQSRSPPWVPADR